VADSSLRDRSTLREIFDVRTTLEGMCARLAADRITPDQVERMEQLLKTLSGSSRQRTTRLC